MVFQEVPLRGQQRGGLLLVALAQRIGGTVGKHLLELQLQSYVVLAFLPAVLLVKPAER